MRHAFALATLLASTSPLMVQADGLLDMSEAERSAFNQAVRDYLVQNPEVIVEAMDELQAREDRMAVEADLKMLSDNREIIENSPHDWKGGNLEGDITLVEFMDYRCGYCHKAYADVEALVAGDGNIRFVLKEFPILGEQSLLASKFAISVRQLYGDEAYKAAHDALFAFRGDFTEESLGRLAQDLGHDPVALNVQMGSPEVQAVIDANYQLAQTMQINGTPSFVLGDTMVRGYVPLADMQNIVTRERSDR